MHAVAVSALLSQIENAFSTRLADQFDVFVGSSAGSYITTLMGCLRYTADEIDSLMEKQVNVCDAHVSIHHIAHTESIT